MTASRWPGAPEDLVAALDEERERTRALADASRAAVRDRVLDRAARGVGPSVAASPFSPVVLAGSAALVMLLGIGIGVGIGLGLGQARTATPPQLPVVTTLPTSPPHAGGPGATAPPPEGAPTAPAPTTDAGPIPALPTTPSRRGGSTGSIPRPTAALPLPDLGAELRVFERAEAARAEGRAAAARREYAAYLERFPAGSLASEARLGAASLALEEGEPAEALAMLAPLRTAESGALRRQAALIEGRAHLALGACAEARAALDGVQAPALRDEVARRCPAAAP